MKTRHRAAVAGAVVLGAIALTGCEKPTPLVTLVSGSTSVNSEAVCHAEGKKLVDLSQCLDRPAREAIDVTAGNSFSVGVDKEIADKGWYLYINGRPFNDEPIKKTFLSSAELTLPSGIAKDAQPFLIQIIQGPNAEQTGAKGVWSFEVKPKQN
jgi:hypothetical protein